MPRRRWPSPPGAGRSLTREIAELSERHERTAKKCAAENGVRSKKGPSTAIRGPCPAIFDALHAAPHRGGYDFEIERLTKAQADKTETETEVLRGNLIPREQVVDWYGPLVSSARARSRSIPTKAAAVVATMSESEAEALLTRYIDYALNESSRPGGPAGSGAAAKADRRAAPGPAEH